MPPMPNIASSIHRSATRLKKTYFPSVASSSPAAVSSSTSSIQEFAIKQCESSNYIDAAAANAVRQRLRNFMFPKQKSDDSSSALRASGDVSSAHLKLHSSNNFEESPRKLLGEMSSIIYDDSGADLDDNYHSSEEDGTVLDVFSNIHLPSTINNPNNAINMSRKEVARERKQKWVIKTGQDGRINCLMTLCKKFGLDATTQILDKCRTETGPEELNALVKCCVQSAREADNEEVSSSQLVHAYKVFELMIERGFQIKEETYGPLLLYLIEARMIQEFHFFCDFIKYEISHYRLAYYEMLLWIGLNDEDKIQELCYSLSLYDSEDKSSFQEHYLLAFCESGRRMEVLRLLNTFDITKVSSDEGIINIFRYLGKLLPVSLAESLLETLKLNGIGRGRFSKIIFHFVTSIPNLAVEDVILKCRNLHMALDVNPTSKHYERLIHFCCRASQVHRALEIVDSMVEAGCSTSLATFHFMLDACVESFEYNLVRRIFPMMSDHDLKPNAETFRIMITLFVKMKDFEGAYRMLADMKTMNIKPTAAVYNAIMAGFFREKNLHGALRVLKRMEDEDLKPDSQTYSYLLINCNREENINKILDEMMDSGIQASKHVYMALVNAYAACGEFEKAKQVLLLDVPLKFLNEIKSVLVSALASNGQMSDALNIYEEIKQSKYNLEPKAVICLIEHLQSTGEMNRLFQLLEELHDPDYWLDGCSRVISYCVHHEHLRPTVDLLTQLRNVAKNDEVPTENLFDRVFCQIAEKDSPDIHFAMELLQAIKEELGVRPSRQSLDFLLTACLNAKDLSSCFVVWTEYEAAGLPYNVLSFVRMYQALLALGDHRSANNILNKIPKDDPHVSCIIKAYQDISTPDSTPKKTKKKKKVKVLAVKFKDSSG